MRINNGDKAFLVEHDIGESCSFKAENGQEVLGLRSLPGLRNELLLLGPFNDDITQQSVSVACGSDAHEAHM